MTQLVGPGSTQSAAGGSAWVRWVGMLVVVVLAAVSAVWEAFLTPMTWEWTSGGHAHYVRLPVALLLAVLCNAALAWLTQKATGNVLAVLAPFVAWVAVIMAAASKTREGDLVLAANNWVAFTIIFVGPLGFAVGAIVVAIRSVRRRSA